MVEITAAEWNIEKKNGKKKKNSLRDLRNHMECTNVSIIGVPEREESTRETV